jgi:hypothetical protein
VCSSDLTDDEISILNECIKDVFDYEFYFKGDWKLGKEHFVPQAIDQTSAGSDTSLSSNQQAF